MNEALVFGIGMEIYSTLLAISVILIGFWTIIHILAYTFSKKIRKKTHEFNYFTVMKIIGALSLISTIAVLVYQFGYILAVCELCWWQRIFMFPIEFIVLNALIKKIKGMHISIMLLSGFGILFAGYHYWLHFKAYVLKLPVTSSCSLGGLLPECTDASGVVIFDFITLPYMALIIFCVIFWLAFIAGRIANKNS